MKEKSELKIVLFDYFSFLPPDNIDDEDGEFKNKEDREHRHMAETEKLRVTWNTERRCYLDSQATKRSATPYNQTMVRYIVRVAQACQFTRGENKL